MQLLQQQQTAGRANGCASGSRPTKAVALPRVSRRSAVQVQAAVHLDFDAKGEAMDAESVFSHAARL